MWVDPLDGTKEYTEGFLDHVTVLIGIAVGKRAVAGVINQPFFNYENKVREIASYNLKICNSGFSIKQLKYSGLLF